MKCEMCVYVGRHIIDGTSESSTSSVGTLITPSVGLWQSVIKPMRRVTLFLSSCGRHNT